MMRIKKLSMIAAVLSLTVLAFAGCGKKNEKNVIDKNTIYKEEELQITLPEDFDYNEIYLAGNKAFIPGSIYDSVNYTAQSLVYVSDIQTGAVNEIKIGEENSNVWISQVIGREDGSLIVFYESYKEDLSDPENPVYENTYSARVYDASGKQVKDIDVQNDFGLDYLNFAKAIGDKLLLSAYDKMILLDSDFKKIKEKESDGDGFDFGGFYTLKDGSVVVTTYGEKGTELHSFDLNNLAVGDKIETKIDTYRYELMQGGEYDFYLRDNVQIYGQNLNDEEPTAILNFINSDIYTNYFQTFATIDANSFIGTYGDWDGDRYVRRICRYTKVKPEDVVDKEILSLGCLWCDSSLKKAVVNYNKTSEKYRINLIDYSIYNTEEDYTAGNIKFNSEVSSGKGPDIVVCSYDNSTINNYISKGLFADLTKYVENDPDVNLDSLIPGIVEACSRNGKLYQIVPSFDIATVAAKKSSFGDKTSWTMGEMLEMNKNLPAGMVMFNDATREGFLDSIFSAHGNEYVDPESGKCNFESDEFKQLLEYIKTLQKNDDYYNSLYTEDFDWSEHQCAVKAGKAMCQPTTIYNTYGYKQLLKAYIGEEITFIGYPGDEGSGSYIQPMMSLGLSSKCKHGDGAWEFMRTFLLPEYFKNLGDIPANKAALEELLAAAKERPYYEMDGEKVYYDDTAWVGGTTITLDPLTDAEVDKLREFIYSVNRMNSSLADIENIIFEEAEPYFEGQKSIDDVVKIIQSRIEIFVSEQR